MEQSIPSWHERLLQAVRSQPKKAGALGVLIIVAGVLWAKSVVIDSRVPAAAAGSVTVPQAVVPAAGANGDARLSAAGRAMAEWLRKPAGPTKRNLFAIRLDRFPSDGSSPAREPETGAEGFWDQLAKSLVAKADQEKDKRILAGNLALEAARLELQSTVMSNNTPKALVNGALVGEGDTVGGFRVVKIEAKRIIVEREGVKIEVLFNFK